MISCTEFIPSYSELFTYLEDEHGADEVRRYWDYLFKPDENGIPLINHVQKEGIRGCWSYWTNSLSEEASDATLYLNEKAGWFMIDMHRCPSKGRLLEMQEKIGVKPYRDYCLHCDYYRLAIEQEGFKYLYNFAGQSKAACSLLIYDPKIFDGRVIVDDSTEVLEVRAAQNEYFHQHFHHSLNRGCEYVAEKFGEAELVEYLTRFTKRVYQKIIADAKCRGLAAIEEKILDTYAREHAEDAVKTHLTDDRLDVQVRYCPAVKYMKSIGKTVSRWYPYSTSVVMDTMAKELGCTFTMQAYDHETGAAHYCFTK